MYYVKLLINPRFVGAGVYHDGLSEAVAGPFDSPIRAVNAALALGHRWGDFDIRPTPEAEPGYTYERLGARKGPG